jgi:anti-anti-sigma regulatory factor
MIAQLQESQPAVGHEGGTTVVAFPEAGAWLGENVIARGVLAAFTGASGRRRLLLDFGRVGHISGGELVTLVAVHKGLAASGGRVVLTHVRPQVYEVFSTAHLHRLLEIYREEAWAAAGR